VEIIISCQSTCENFAPNKSLWWLWGLTRKLCYIWQRDVPFLFTFLISYQKACEDSAAQIKTHIRLHHFSLQFMQLVDFSYLMIKWLFTVVNLNPTHWSSFHVNFHGQAMSSSLPVPLKASSPARLQRNNGFSLNLCSCSRIYQKDLTQNWL
jgi:hypothetical protein